MSIKAGGGPWEVVGLLSWFNSNLYLGNKDGGGVKRQYRVILEYAGGHNQLFLFIYFTICFKN